MRIVSENLSYTYSEKIKSMSVRALNNVSLVIEEGDFFGVIGETGSGKSTFIQHLNGLIKTDGSKGKITVGEFDLTDKKCDFKKLRSKVGMVFQYPEYQLFAETVEADVTFGLKNCHPEYTEEEKKQATKEAIELMGLCYEEIKDKSPFELSGGQKRRVAIAGVLVLKPEVLVLDEPAAGLDPKGKTELLSLLKDIHGKIVKTIIIVSHDMNLITEHCNKVAVFHKGEVLTSGAPGQIFKNIECIKTAGLRLPLTAKIYFALKEKGIELEGDLTEKNVIEKISLLKGGKK